MLFIDVLAEFSLCTSSSILSRTSPVPQTVNEATDLIKNLVCIYLPISMGTPQSECETADWGTVQLYV